MFNMPQSKQWVGYRDLSRELGDVLYFQVLGQSVVVLGSAEAIFEYLDKQSANTSDRVQTPMVDLCGANFGIGFMPYAQWWRRHRRAIWQYFHRDATKQHQVTQQSVTHIFLEKLLENPSHLKRLVRFNFAASILKIVYGLDIKNENDVYIQMLEEAMIAATEGLMPGKFLVDFLTFLRYIPPWFPGATSQRLWTKWMAASNKLKNVPFESFKVKLEHGEATQSITSKLL